MSDNYTAWLGPAADELSSRERARFDRIADDLTGRYPEYPDADPATGRGERNERVVRRGAAA